MTEYTRLVSALSDLDDGLADSFTPAKPRIFIVAYPTLFGDVSCSAVAEDGTTLIHGLFTRPERAQTDMDYIGDASHDKYSEHYPQGFELVWVDDPDENEGWREAMRRNRQEER